MCHAPFDSIPSVGGAANPSPRQILVVEDDRTLRAAIARALTGAGFAVTEVGDGAAAVALLRSAHPEVVLLDIGLPFVDGWRVLGEMHHGRQPPVIIISARGDEQDKVRALDMGADDYLAKPFGTEELLARIRAVLRRAQPPDHPPATVRANGIVVDLGARSVTREGGEVRLSPTEYLLLAELARHAHEVMEFRTLLQRVWGPTYADERHYLRVFIQRLRRKLEKDPAHPAVILTVAGRGYRFGAVAER
jgi:two-component system KDP operon response regulator KdpE